MRHKQVTKCAVGAFAFYLYFRFHISREMDDEFRPDFTDNKSWYEIKILSDGTRNNKKVMAKKSYIDDVREIFKELKIVTSHFGHWGRVSAPVELEFNELSPELIRILGESSCVFVLVDCCVE
jgi:predicted TIM-barrel fold metal-dependent hydrolase